MDLVRRVWLLVAVSAAAALCVGLWRVAADSPRDWESMLRQCAVLPVDSSVQECTRATLAEAIASREFQVAAPVLVQLSKEVEGFQWVCHAALHSLGDVVWQTFDSAAAVIENSSPRACGDGLAHASMEALATSDGTTEESLRAAAIACADFVKPGSDGCAHGLGHGAFGFVQGDPPGDRVRAALELCLRILSGGSTESTDLVFPVAEGCGYGVLMSAYAGSGVVVVPLSDPARLPQECVFLEPGGSVTDAVGALRERLHRGCMAGVGFAFGQSISTVPQEQRRSTIEQLVGLCMSGLPASSLSSVQCTNQTLMWAAPSSLESPSSFHAFCRSLGERFGRPVRLSCLSQPVNSMTREQFEAIARFDPSLTDEILELSADFSG